MKKMTFWRICFILMHKLAYEDAIHGMAFNRWPHVGRMLELWNANQIPGQNMEFPLRLYRRLRKHRNDIKIMYTTIQGEPLGKIGPAMADAAYDTMSLIENGYRVRVWNGRLGESYIVGVRGEIAGLWR